MNKKIERIEELARGVAPDWQWDKYAKVRQAVEDRRRRSHGTRFVAMTIALAGASAAVVTLLVLHLSKPQTNGVAQVPHKPSAEPVVATKLPDPVVAATASADPAKGLEIRAGRADTVVRSLPSATNTSYELTRGEATFVVKEPLPKPLTIQVRDLVVKDIGTVFSVAMQPNKTVIVSVSEGLVQVNGPGVDVFINAGQTRRFPWGSQQIAPAVVAARRPTAVRIPPVPPAPAVPATEPAPMAPRWVELAELKHYQEAFVHLQAEDPPEDTLSPAELLLAADAARLSRHERQALPYLNNYLKRFGQQNDVPLVQFTLGKVLMSVGQYAQAAETFELIQDGTLAQESFVRAIEARLRAGDRQSAQALAQKYARRFPQGMFHGRIAALLQ